MAKLVKLPSLATISGFKGVIDFYIHDGVPCARKWPRSPGHRRAPAVVAQWAAFSYSAWQWNNLSPEIQDAYKALASGTGLSGRDMFTRSYITGLYRYPTGEP